jgi:drug/metabolite transporter (DMT)-like permease
MSAPPLDLVNNLLLFVSLLFAVCVACELLKDDMKILYQGVILLVDSALLLVTGWYFYTGIADGASTVTDPYYAIILATFGGLCIVLFIFIWLPRVLSPYKMGADYPAVGRKPARPREPGGWE